MRSSWLRLTEETNALDFLERAGEFIAKTEKDKWAWKWVALALHGALYGFAIAACRGTDDTSVVRHAKSGRGHLISLDEALTRCADRQWMGTLYGGQPLALTEGQEDSVRRLKKTLRNNFEHFQPGGWSIEIHGLPRISLDILDIINFLALETARYQHLTAKQRRRITSVCRRSKKLLCSSKLYTESLKHAQKVA